MSFVINEVAEVGDGDQAVAVDRLELVCRLGGVISRVS